MFMVSDGLFAGPRVQRREDAGGAHQVCGERRRGRRARAVSGEFTLHTVLRFNTYTW